MEPIVLDRSTLENYATCPFMGYCQIIFNALQAKAKNERLSDLERQRLEDADPEFIAKIAPYAKAGTSSVICDSGTEVHRIIEEAFNACENNLEEIPEFIEKTLPKVRPDIAPEVLRAARHVCDVVAELHVTTIGPELQMSYEILPETKSRPAVVVTQCLDLLSQGLNKSLHIHDWKTGYKQRSDTEAFDSFQGQCAALLCWKTPEYREVEKIHFWYIETRYGSRAYAGYERSDFHPKLPHLSQEVVFEHRVDRVVKILLADVRECWPLDKKCCWCDYIRFCPNAHIDAIEIEKDPAGFVDRLIVLTQLVKKMKKNATEWVKAKGPLIGKVAVFQKKKPTDRFTTEVVERNGETKEQIARRSKVTEFSSVGDSELDTFFK